MQGAGSREQGKELEARCERRDARGERRNVRCEI